MASYQFLLKPNTLECSFKKLSIPNLNRLKLHVAPIPNIFILFRQDGGDVIPEMNELKLICENADDYQKWKNSFESLLCNDVAEVS